MLDKITSYLIAEFANHHSTTPVVIQKEGEQFGALFQREISAKEAHLTKVSLKELIGKERLERLFLRPELGLNWHAFQSEKLIVTKEIIQKIWAGLADIRKGDLDFALGRDAQGCSVVEIQRAYKSLVPVRAKSLFTKVEIYDKAKTSGKGFHGLMERVWTLLSGWKQGDSYEDVEAFTSRLADREPPVGTVAWFDTGYHVAEKIFSGNGAYVTLWRHLSEPSRYLLVCRGTASRRTATSGLMSAINDLTKEIGFAGVRAIWPALSRYIAEKKVEKIDLIGKSLGGGHVQYLETLLLGKTQVQVENIKTYCAVGTPKSVQAIYDRVIGEKSKQAPSVTIFRNGGDAKKKEMDFVPYVGGSHLHSQGKTTVFYAVPKGQELYKGSAKLWGLLQSFGKAHNRQTSMKEYELLESHDIDAEVAVGTVLESTRHKIACLFNIITFGYFNQETFAAFYEREKNITR